MKLLHRDGVKALIVYASMVAAFVLSFETEMALAKYVGFSDETAWLFPVAVDAYALSAIIRNREVLISVGAMVALNVTSHLVTTDGDKAKIAVTAIVSAVPPLILWRTHHVAQEATEVNTPTVSEHPSEHPGEHPGEHQVFTGPDLRIPGTAQIIEAAVERGGSPASHAAYGTEVPPAKQIDLSVNTPVNTPVNTSRKDSVLALLNEGVGVREVARRVGVQASYVSRLKNADA